MATAQNSKGSPTSSGGKNANEMNPGERDRMLRRLRRFHMTGPIPDGAEEAPSGDCAPALLVPLRQLEEVRHDYPLFLYPEQRIPDGELCAPLGRFVTELLDTIDKGETSSPLIRANLLKLEKSMKRLLASETKPIPAADLLSRAKETLLRELKQEGEEQEQMAGEIDRLVAAIPAGGFFLGFSSLAPIHLFLSSVRAIRKGRQDRFRLHIAALLKKIRELLAVEQSKAPSSRQAEGLRNTVGDTGEKLIDSEEMSRVIGSRRGSGMMEEGGQERIEGVVKILADYLQAKEPPLIRLVHEKSLDTSPFEDAPDSLLEESDDPCGDAHRRFDQLAEEHLHLFRAIRIAELEVEKKYYPPHHDPWFGGFSKATLTAGELMELPLVTAVDSADRIAREGLLSLSTLLRSGFPVHILVPLRPGQNPGDDTGIPSNSGYRLEIGYMGISQREAWVDQSSAARPDHLTQSFSRSLGQYRTALHVYASGLDREGHAPRLNTWLHAEVELGGRAHSFFRFNPDGGVTWADRFEFDGNPQADCSWPQYPLNITDHDGNESEVILPFTFADFALLEKEYAPHFHFIPDSVNDKMLVDTGTYLDMNHETMENHIPFVYAMDGRGGNSRFAITRRLADLCRDRLNFWTALQELAGVQNQYAVEAAKRARETTLAEVSAEREALIDSHHEELKSLRKSIAEGMIEGLVGTLLQGESFDISSAASRITGEQAAAVSPAEKSAAPAEAAAEASPVKMPAADPPVEKEATPAPAAESPAPETPPAAAEEEDVEEPWVETAECTTCNECLNVNDALFVYDDNDQCEIGDPKGGTYEEMVRAAEACPVGIIHPGTPLNRDEPNLEELKKKAEAFR